MRDFMFKKFRYIFETLSIRDRAYNVSSNNTDLTNQIVCKLAKWKYLVLHQKSNKLLTSLNLDMLLVEPQNSEEAELNFMVICLIPVSI